MTQGQTPPFVAGDRGGSDISQCLAYDSNGSCTSWEFTSENEGPWVVGGLGRPDNPMALWTTTGVQGAHLSPTTSGILSPLVAPHIYMPDITGLLAPGKTPQIPVPYLLGATYAWSSVGYSIDPIQIPANDYFADAAAISQAKNGAFGGGVSSPCVADSRYKCYVAGFNDLNQRHTSSPGYSGLIEPGMQLNVTRQGTPGFVGVSGGESAEVADIMHGIVHVEHCQPDGNCWSTWQHDGEYFTVYLTDSLAWDKHDANASAWTNNMFSGQTPCQQYMGGALGQMLGSNNVAFEFQSWTWNQAPALVKATGGIGNSIFDFTQTAGDCVASHSEDRTLPNVSFPMTKPYTDPANGYQYISYYDSNAFKSFTHDQLDHYSWLQSRIFQWEDSCSQQETPSGLDLTKPCSYTDQHGEVHYATWSQVINGVLQTIQGIGISSPVGHPEQAYVYVKVADTDAAGDTTTINGARYPTGQPGTFGEKVSQSLTYWGLTLVAENVGDEIHRWTGLPASIPTDSTCGPADILCMMDYVVAGITLSPSYQTTLTGWFNKNAPNNSIESLQQKGVIVVNGVALTPPPGPVNPFTGMSDVPGVGAVTDGGTLSTSTLSPNNGDSANGAPAIY